MTQPPAPGSSVPHVTFTETDGTTVAYADVWQRSQLLLVLLPPDAGPAWDAYMKTLDGMRPRFAALETTLVVSADGPEPFEAPIALVADRWGEVMHAAPLREHGGVVTPDVALLLAWVEATLHRCPECEGEAL
jgi:hypothetical protein